MYQKIGRGKQLQLHNVSLLFFDLKDWCITVKLWKANPASLPTSEKVKSRSPSTRTATFSIRSFKPGRALATINLEGFSEEICLLRCGIELTAIRIWFLTVVASYAGINASDVSFVFFGFLYPSDLSQVLLGLVSQPRFLHFWWLALLFGRLFLKYNIISVGKFEKWFILLKGRIWYVIQKLWN